MTKKRNIVLAVILAIVLAGHVAMFAAGGSWRTAGIALVCVDITTGWIVVGAIREFRKADGGEASK